MIGAFLAAACGLASAQIASRTWDTLVVEGGRAIAEGRYKAAESAYEAALDLAQGESGSNESVATALHLLASTYSMEGRTTEAEPLALRALAIREKSLGTKHPATARTMVVLGMIYDASARYGEAERLLRRAVAVEEGNAGSRGVELAGAYHALARVLLSQREYREAQLLVKRALAIWGKEAPADDLDRASALDTLGEILSARRRFRESEVCYRGAVELSEQKPGPAYATLLVRGLTDLALLRLRNKNYLEAERIAHRAMAIAGAESPHERLLWAGAAAVLASALTGQQHMEEADDYYEQALAVYEHSSATRSGAYASTLGAYARFLRLAKRPKEAAEIQSRLAAILAFHASTVEASGLRRQ